ncbi:hypothetical protein [Enterococcus dongliensis]|uniref:hypothetical protein n=1 Tax=Enterococcus dongliensis TaxID=2559925 RepID=UPI002890A152|nr:hypothetical protein [Enterococcus dongliensis]MDT2613766.1 hypothetical protein [Enterococcus dongliensis]MDT2674171.1 hypothetical protein [Enterococcus dongliensis]
MSKEKLFYVEKNDSWHSYEFLAQRQKDPKWRQAFLEAQELLEQQDKQRKRRNFILLIVAVPVILIAVLVGLYFYGSSDEEMIPKRQISLNDSTVASTETAETTEITETTSIGQVLTTPWGEQVTVLRVLSNGERVIREGASQSDLNNDGLLTFEELSQVEETANQNNQQYEQANNQPMQPTQSQQTPQQGQNEPNQPNVQPSQTNEQGIVEETPSQSQPNTP